MGFGLSPAEEHDISEPSPRFWEILFDLFENLPRQGPGSRACAEKALGILDRLAQEPEMHRRHSDCYAYEFFIARRPTKMPEPNSAIRRKP